MKLHFLFIYLLVSICGFAEAMIPHQSKSRKSSKRTAARKPTVITSKKDANDKLFAEFLRIIKDREIMTFSTILEKVQNNDLLQRLDVDGKNALQIELEQKQYNEFIIKALIKAGIQLEPSLQLARTLAEEHRRFKREIYPLFNDPEAATLGLIDAQTNELSKTENSQDNSEAHTNQSSEVAIFDQASKVSTESHYGVTPGNPALAFTSSSTKSSGAFGEQPKNWAVSLGNKQEKMTIMQLMGKHPITTLISVVSSLSLISFAFKKYIHKRQECTK